MSCRQHHRGATKLRSVALLTALCAKQEAHAPLHQYNAETGNRRQQLREVVATRHSTVELRQEAIQHHCYHRTGANTHKETQTQRNKTFKFVCRHRKQANLIKQHCQKLRSIRLFANRKHASKTLGACRVEKWFLPRVHNLTREITAASCVAYANVNAIGSMIEMKGHQSHRSRTYDLQQVDRLNISPTSIQQLPQLNKGSRK
jgi:hypothetical protein